MAARRSVQSRNRRRKKNKNDQISLVRPVAFAVILCLAIGLRFVKSGPIYNLRQKISATLDTSINLNDAVEVLGKAFTGEKENGENAVVVFGRMILGIEEEPEEKPPTPISNNVYEEISPFGENTTAGDLSGLSFQIAEAPLPVMGSIDLSVMGSLEDEIYDGTPNESFKIPSPDIVDETKYTLPFKVVMPVNGTFTSPFGYRIHPISGNTTFHYGVDLAAPSGRKVVSIAAGTVAETGYNSVNGNYIKVQHADGFLSLYAHLSKINVKRGAKVTGGQQIGAIGSTGYSTGPHLHFEVRKNGKILNPSDYFKF